MISFITSGFSVEQGGILSGSTTKRVRPGAFLNATEKSDFNISDKDT